MEFFPARRPCPLGELPTMAAIAPAHGLSFLGVTLIDHPRAGCLTFCERAPGGDLVDPSFASTILVSHALAYQFARSYPAASLLPVDDPRAVFIDTLDYLQRNDLLGATSLLPHAPSISPEARIGEGAVVEAGVQVDAGVRIGSGAVVRAGTWLRRGASIGENCVIGGTGINAYMGQDGRRRGFPHLAGVIVGEDASIGASCVVVRGILSSTRIGAGCIIGNLCNVGHGVEIEDNAWISVGTLIGGHTRIGAGATIAMGCTIRDNVRIGAGANVGMGSVVTKHVRAGASVFGNPARAHTSITAGPTR
ncbi:MAG TPA: DapH/DapD/GlmU-related protein [Xanthomonadaceae bacterium]|jgi:UDP-3-O-[3-hydroxymyristoyl] glucosamine N-acyltransferase